jgi:hypothetical protein
VLALMKSWAANLWIGGAGRGEGRDPGRGAFCSIRLRVVSPVASSSTRARSAKATQGPLQPPSTNPVARRAAPSAPGRAQPRASASSKSGGWGGRLSAGVAGWVGCLARRPRAWRARHAGPLGRGCFRRGDPLLAVVSKASNAVAPGGEGAARASRPSEFDGVGECGGCLGEAQLGPPVAPGPPRPAPGRCARVRWASVDTLSAQAVRMVSSSSSAPARLTL